MKKILYVITKSNWGGAQRHVFDLASNLPKDEFEAVVAFGGTGLSGAAPGALEEKLRAASVRTLFVQSFMRDISLWREFSALRELVRIFKDERPDVAHLHSSKAGGVGALAARMAGVPKILFTVHGLPWDEDRHILSRLAIYLASWATFLLCHTVVAISDRDALRLRSLPGCKNKVRLVRNGIAPLAFLEQGEARAKLASTMHPLPQPLFWIGTVGELTWNKGHHILIKAAGILNRDKIDCEVCIVGEGEERPFLETLIAEEKLEGRAHLTGFVPHASELLKAFDIFVLPSIKEGLPYVLLEAGQAARPVVASHVGSMPDALDDEVSGLLIKPKDAHALADALKKLIADEAKRLALGQALQARMSKEFTLAAMVTETSALYRS